MSLSEAGKRLARLFATRLEPCLFRLRTAKRLRLFGLAAIGELPKISLLLNPDCRNEPSCPRLAARYARYYRRFLRVTPTPPGAMTGAGLLACIDLDNYGSAAAMQTALKKHSENFFRNIRKAEKAGYSVSTFHPQNHTPDLCAIRKSRLWRAFGPVFDVLTLTVDELGGAPEHWHQLLPPECNEHWDRYFGVFIDRPGHHQGRLATDRELVAYARVHRVGNTLRYAEFIGHGAHLHKGVMMLLHREVLVWLLRPENSMARGARYLTYGAIEQGSSGLLFWKRRAMFTPCLLKE